MRTSYPLSLLLSLTIAAFAWPQKPDEPKPPPALTVNADLPGPFQPYNITGKDKHRGTYHCLISENGLNPVAMVLVRGADVPPAVADLLKELDALVEKHQRARLGGFAVFVSDTLDDVAGKDDDREKEVARVEQFGNGLKNVPIALDSLAALKKAGYPFDDKHAITVVLYNRLKVVEVLKFAGNAFDADAVKKVGERVTAMLKEVEATRLRNAEPTP